MAPHLAHGLLSFLLAIPIGNREGCFLLEDDLEEGTDFYSLNGNLYLNWFALCPGETKDVVLAAVISDFCENVVQKRIGQGEVLALPPDFYRTNRSRLIGVDVTEPVTQLEEWRAQRLKMLEPPDAQVISIQPYLDLSRHNVQATLADENTEGILYAFPNNEQIKEDDFNVEALPEIDSYANFVKLCMYLIETDDPYLFTKILQLKGLSKKQAVQFTHLLQCIPVGNFLTVEQALYYCPDYYHLEPKPINLNLFQDVASMYKTDVIAMIASYWYQKQYGDTEIVHDTRD